MASCSSCRVSAFISAEEMDPSLWGVFSHFFFHVWQFSIGCKITWTVPCWILDTFLYLGCSIKHEDFQSGWCKCHFVFPVGMRLKGWLFPLIRNCYFFPHSIWGWGITSHTHSEWVFLHFHYIAPTHALISIKFSVKVVGSSLGFQNYFIWFYSSFLFLANWL